MSESNEISLRDHLRRAGSVKSDLKATTSAQNGQRGGRPPGATGKVLKPCDCGGPPHVSRCPVYQRNAQRKARAAKQNT